ncbi:hypothetical protein GPECTOR_36g51 [Gonium pectorale]|uniref:Uncharacterized protein n=1 Tax=Gonium pectorale TaxID=33097 RepID=A0A150GBU6_GONPE|nr:hypothetical protein GPECTOR_36g51 [Gonium pectorale]|eukprot:KXZ47327.1 hypothetical protein GPECTOR_36g51 [Gonium pectorale]
MQLTASRLGTSVLGRRSGRNVARPAVVSKARQGRKAVVVQANLFSRVTRIVNSWATNVVSNAEDPEKLLDQVVEEMQNDLIKMRQAAATILAQQKQIEAKYKQAQTTAEQADTLKLQVDQLSVASGDVLNNTRALEAKLSEARSKKETLKARAASAKTSQQIQEMMSGLNTSNAVVAFEKMEQKVLSMEAQAESTKLLVGSDTVDNRFKALESGTVDDELAALKRGMIGSGSAPAALPEGRPVQDALDLELEALRRKARAEVTELYIRTGRQRLVALHARDLVIDEVRVGNTVVQPQWLPRHQQRSVDEAKEHGVKDYADYVVDDYRAALKAERAQGDFAVALDAAQADGPGAAAGTNGPASPSATSAPVPPAASSSPSSSLVAPSDFAHCSESFRALLMDEKSLPTATKLTIRYRKLGPDACVRHLPASAAAPPAAGGGTLTTDTRHCAARRLVPCVDLPNALCSWELAVETGLEHVAVASGALVGQRLLVAAPEVVAAAAAERERGLAEVRAALSAAAAAVEKAEREKRQKEQQQEGEGAAAAGAGTGVGAAGGEERRKASTLALRQ